VVSNDLLTSAPATHREHRGPAVPGTRVFVLIPTHTTRHLRACLASLAHQQRLPDGVVVTCDTDKPDIGELLDTWWPQVCVKAGRVMPLWHALRPHQGQAQLNQVRNNGLRTLMQHGDGHSGATTSDLVVVLDGDTMLARASLTQHAEARDSGFGLIIPYRVMLGEPTTAAVDPQRVLDIGLDERAFLSPHERTMLKARQRRYSRHLLWRKLGFGKTHKPKIIGGHHAFTIESISKVNGFDEDYIGYRFNDDDMSRRINSLRPMVKTLIACDAIHAFHLWHPVRAPERLEDAPGFARFARRDLPIYAQHGLTSPRQQPEVIVRAVHSPGTVPAPLSSGGR